MILLDLLRAAAALAQLLSIVKRLAARRDLRGRLAEVLLPILRDLRKSMEELDANGQRLKENLGRVPTPLNRKDSNELVIAWAAAVDATAGVIEQVHRLGRAANGVAAFKTFMERLKTADPGACELLRLLDRGYKDGVLDLREVPTFAKLFGPKGRRARNLRSVAEKAVKEATPLVEKARAVRVGRRLDRQVVQRVVKSIRHLARVQRLVRKIDPETARTLDEVSPDWVQPLVALGKRVKVE